MIRRFLFGLFFVGSIFLLFVHPTYAASSAPDLYQVDVTSHEATIYFSPSEDAVSYNIFYATSPSAEQYSVHFAPNSQTGAQSYTIRSLSSNTTYYVKVGGVSSSQQTEWSSVMKITIPASGQQSFYEHAPNATATPSPQPKKDVLGASTSIFDNPTFLSIKKTVCQIFVQYGDAIWSVATSFLGNPYKQIADKNKSNVATVGHLLNIGC